MAWVCQRNTGINKSTIDWSAAPLMSASLIGWKWLPFFIFVSPPAFAITRHLCGTSEKRAGLTPKPDACWGFLTHLLYAVSDLSLLQKNSPLRYNFLCSHFLWESRRFLLPLSASGWLLHWIFPLCSNSEDISTPCTWQRKADIRHSLAAMPTWLQACLNLLQPTAIQTRIKSSSPIFAPNFLLKSWTRNSCPHCSLCHVIEVLSHKEVKFFIPPPE